MSDPSGWGVPDPAQRQTPGWAAPDPGSRSVAPQLPARPTPIPAPAPSPSPAVAPDPRAFAGVRARWLILFAVVGLVVVMVGLAAVTGLVGMASEIEEALAALIYVPLILWILFVAWHNRVRLGYFLRWPRIGAYWWVVLGMAVALFVFSIGASAITAALLPGYVAGAEVSTGPGPLLMFVSLVVLPAFVEEFVFRGILLERWAVKWRLGTAIVVQSICFGILHVDPLGAGVFGVVMALLYLRARSLWVPISVHALNNGVVMLLVFATEGSEATDTASAAADPIGAIVGGLVMIALSAPFIVWFIRVNWRGPDSLTPYEENEFGAAALPPRHLGPVHVGGEKYRLSVDTQSVLVSRDRSGRNLAWRFPFAETGYVGITRDWSTVSLGGPVGGPLPIELGRGGRRAHHRLAAALNDRIITGGGASAVWS